MYLSRVIVRRAQIAGAASAAVMLLASNVAVALTTPYYGNQCQPADGNSDFGGGTDTQLTYDSGSRTVKNTSSSNATVVCPIPKLTSSFGKSGDNLTGLSMTASGGTSVSCTLNVWDVFNPNNTRPLNAATDALSGFTPHGRSHSFTLSANITRINTWDGPNNNFEWLYSDLTCTISPGTTINSYRVTEQGSPSSAPVAIYPASFCRPTGTGSYNFYDYTDQPGSGGFVHSIPSGGFFQFQCPLSLGYQQGAYVAIGPSTNDSYDIGCLFGNDWTTWQQQASGSGEWPAQALDFHGLESSPLTCQLTQGGSDGDAKILSILTWTSF
jgi:hypothetical protein